MNELNLKLAEVLSQIRKGEKQDETYDKILKQHDVTTLSGLEELRYSYKELQNWVKCRLSDLEVSEYLIFLAKETMVGV
jgi:hypothetical protein